MRVHISHLAEVQQVSNLPSSRNSHQTPQFREIHFRSVAQFGARLEPDISNVLPPPSPPSPLINPAPLQPQPQGGQTQPESGPPQQGAVSQSRTSVTGEVAPPFSLIFLLTPPFGTLAPHFCLPSSQILSLLLAPYFPLLVIFFSLLTPNFSFLPTYSSVFPPCSSLLTYLPTFPTSLLSYFCPLHSSLLTPTIFPSLSTLHNFTL